MQSNIQIETIDSDFLPSNNPKYPTLEPRQPFHRFPWTLPLRSTKMELEDVENHLSIGWPHNMWLFSRTWLLKISISLWIPSVQESCKSDCLRMNRCKWTVWKIFEENAQSPVTTLMLWLHFDMELGVVKLDHILTP